MDWFLYDKDLRNETVKENVSFLYGNCWDLNGFFTLNFNGNFLIYENLTRKTGVKF